MGYEIRRLSEQDKADHKAKHEMANPKDFVLMDGWLVYSFYDTEEEAQTEMAQLQLQDTVSDLFEVWLTEASEELGLSEEIIRGIIKGD